MEIQVLQQQTTDDRKEQNSHRNTIITQQPQHPRFKECKWWFRVSLYIIFLLVGQSSATLLGRLYYDKGGNSKWMATFVQSAGFPVLFPLLCYFPPHAKFTNMHNIDSSKTKPKISTLVSLYLDIGLLLTGDNLMYSYGLLYLPLFTYSLLYDRKEQNSHRNTTITEQPQHPRFKECKWWFRVSLYIIFLLVGQSSATLLGRLYYDKGGNSKWMATFVQSAGFPVLFPLLCYFPPHAKFTNMHNIDSSKTKPKISTLVSLYLAFGLLLAGDNLMYSYGLLYLPVSTYSLLCASQLAFNALFSFFLSSQKFTALIFNSVVHLTISAALLAVNADSEGSMGLPRGKYIIGLFCTLGASATFSLYVSLVQLSFDKVIKRETFSAILDMQLYPSFISTCASVVGLFASGEWKTLNKEMKEYQKGRVSYIMTLLWTAVTWQISSIGMLGLVSEVSSLFSNVIGTLALPIVPIFAVLLSHDKINGVKVIALLLAVWGFLSYIYQHYLDDKKAKADKSDGVEVSRGEVEIC